MQVLKQNDHVNEVSSGAWFASSEQMKLFILLLFFAFLYTLVAWILS